MTEAPYRKWQCPACGEIYDEALGTPELDVAPGTRLEDLPDWWICPGCGSPRGDFVPYDA